MVESTALEMRRTGNCTGGSNPSLSAKSRGKYLVGLGRNVKCKLTAYNIAYSRSWWGKGVDFTAASFPTIRSFRAGHERRPVLIAFSMTFLSLRAVL